MDPELTILLESARTVIDEESATRLDARCRQGVKWPLLLALADRHGLVPLLSRNLELICPDAIPPDVLAWLRTDAHRSAVRSRGLEGHLTQVLAALTADGIRAVPFKGPALAWAAYGDVRLRSFVDLDILVRKADVSRTRDRLAAAGYRRRLAVEPRDEQAFVDALCEEPLVHEASGVCVDLHWEIAPRQFGMSLEAWGFWDRLRFVTLNGRPLLAPPTEDLLILLCVHASKHLWERLAWTVDLAELVRRNPRLDWPETLARARALGAERMLLIGLGLAEELLGAKLASPIGLRLRADRHARRLRSRVCGWLQDGRVPAAVSPAAARFHLAMRERLRDRVCYATRAWVTLSPDDWTGAGPNGRPRLLRRLMRPLRLARKYWAATIPRMPG